MNTKPYNIQAPEDIAKEYGGNKQKIAKAAQMGLLDPTAAVLAGMFIDRMRGAQAQEQAPQQTVAQQTFAPTPPAPAPAPMQGPQRALGATPQAPQMMAMQQQMAPRRGVRGMDRIPTNPNMMPSAASGGLVAFAAGDMVTDNPLYGEMQAKEARLREEQSNLERALVPLRRKKELGLPSPALDSTEARLAEVQRMITGLPRELAESLKSQDNLQTQSFSGPPTDAAGVGLSDEQFMEEAYRGDDGAQIVQDQIRDQVLREKAERDAATQVPPANQEPAVQAAPETENREPVGRGLGMFAGADLTPKETAGEPAVEDPYKEVSDILAREPNKKGVLTDAIAEQTKPKSAVEKAKEEMDKKKESGDSYMPDFMKTSAEDLDSDTTLEGTAADIDAIANSGLGEEEQAALDYYKQAETRAKDAQRKNMAMFLIEVGAGMAAGESPYALQNVGKAVKSALPQYRSGMEASKKEVQAAMDKRASFDVIRNKRQIQNLTLALDKYKGDTANDIRKKITALEQNNKVLLAGMDIDARKEMQILNLISAKEEKQADREHTTRENEANRYMQERIKALDIYGRATEGKLQRQHEFSLADKQNIYASARLQAEQMFKGEQNRLQRENALKAVEMQVNAPTNETRQLERFAAYIREQNPKMTDAQVNDLAQRAVFDAQAAVVNAAKFDAIAYDVVNNAYKNAADAWDNMPVGRERKGMTRDKFINQEIQNQLGYIRDYTNVLGNKFSSGRVQEENYMELYK